MHHPFRAGLVRPCSRSANNYTTNGADSKEELKRLCKALGMPALGHQARGAKPAQKSFGSLENLKKLLSGITIF
jgi:hypothetical protein